MLPLLERGSAHMPSPGSAEAAPAKALKVLVVDDNEDSADSMALLLDTYGHNVKTAYGGAQAIDIAGVFCPDLILLDLSMPLMTGFEAIPLLRDAVGNDDLVVAAMTGFGLEADKQRTTAAGFDAHLTKPVDVRDLEAVIAMTSGAAGKRMRPD
jgi:CheY-like chemotaxis protein